MAVLPIRPTPFFANKNQAFWNLQLAGWGGATLLRAMSALANGQSPDRLVIILIATITGFSLSLILAVIYGQVIRQRPLVTWGSTALVLALATGVYAFIDSWVLQVAGAATDGNFASLFVGIYFIDLVLLGAWSALYYAINFFLQVEEQADRLERLEAQATSAQLAMLRYQLNPHFLFNTLNSISTLVLLKQSETANAMLTRLSSFLRHTLVTQPGGKVTVAQEMETLQLYLGIEQMRFEERLRSDFRVEPDAAKAQLPAMLLQPLVENAIKYGVSPQEEGAEIAIVAQVVGPRLRVTVSDTGPGMTMNNIEAGLPAVRPTHARRDSTGVGLANIRDRLAQAYGEEHRFEIRSPESGGFSVLIELPFETEESAALSEATAEPAQAAPPKKPSAPSAVVTSTLPPKAHQTT
ncbi:MAG: histidine kinase [Pseudomonadota bacterium]|jgi:signal transduction histidine kinase|uniref:Sensor histidine kinase n=1 Tax=Qipengyuania flava TaxID=192812 RepID=A0A222ES55_9SPHN|nr:histidine kinase [Qipengyuania flava]KZX52191.1 histidine kinase [Erythrobacter sp. HI00D59]KZX88731.1 histidine kinase [Erythrobacter sp. HI0020]KZY12285.1 histidine kinase [Erythrobacter sp. HI0038]KZY22045.1 histidine kinase [Erythrobacter sp. HI0037]MEC7162471.1 histidine kinase [Pseudomonadota bacterium]OAN83780.1 histidine kinase [Erythrobacter sp. EhN03]HCS18500.1 sensor histidine kinase [Erythrobacter sp.]|tara:strand:+ start:444 stop:1673 length:1230 start_codon:yes stop_codon:yes gene_type:complete